jgi:hypothetical protein
LLIVTLTQFKGRCRTIATDPISSTAAATMNRQSSIEDTVGGAAAENDSGQQSGGDLRKTSLTTGIGDIDAESSKKLSGFGAKATLGSPSGVRKSADDSEGDDAKTGESTIGNKRSRLRLQDVEGELEKECVCFKFSVPNTPLNE